MITDAALTTDFYSFNLSKKLHWLACGGQYNHRSKQGDIQHLLVTVLCRVSASLEGRSMFTLALIRPLNRSVCRGKTWCKWTERSLCFCEMKLSRGMEKLLQIHKGKDRRGLRRPLCWCRELAQIGPLECVNCSNNTAQLIHRVIPPSVHRHTHRHTHRDWADESRTGGKMKYYTKKTKGKQDSVGSVLQLRGHLL